MRFRDFIARGVIVGDLASTTKKEAIAEMTDALSKAQLLSADLRQGVLKALLNREELGTTGIGQGIAIPHAKHPGVKKLTGLFARSREGVEFLAPDNQPVHIFFGITAPTYDDKVFLQFYKWIAQSFLQEEWLFEALLDAEDEHEIIATLSGLQ